MSARNASTANSPSSACDVFWIIGEHRKSRQEGATAPRLLREVRDVIGERRVTIVFDRGGQQLPAQRADFRQLLARFGKGAISHFRYTSGVV